jgi:hypothetical protein
MISAPPASNSHHLTPHSPASTFTGFVSLATSATNWCTLLAVQPECPLLPSFGDPLNFVALGTN